MTCRSVLILAILAAPFSLRADWQTEVRTLRPHDTSAAQASVLDELEQRARRALDRIPRAVTQADAERTRPVLRRRLEDSLGFRRLPWPPDLRASITGTLRRDGYRIQKIMFQSLPDVWVPAHLYLPDNLRGPAPAVLFYNGHWWPDSKSRPDFQAFCINMARWGFVVFSFDPFGQGERGVSSRDHRRTETLLVGVAQQGIAEYETRCALEYLLSRPEVDRGRVGMTGASGGGYNTWITGALDDRIAVVVPVVGTSEFFEQIHVTRPLDWYHASEHCHFVPGLIQYANNHEFVSMVAPRPLMIIAASQDQSFPIAGVRTVADYSRKLYTAYGAADKTGFFEDKSEGHGYQKAKREAAYGWFLRWLMHRGDGRPMPEPPTVTSPFDDPELRVFPDGKRPAGPGIIREVRALAEAKPAKRVPVAQLMGKLPEETKIAVEAPSYTPRGVARALFQVQPGITIPAFELRAEYGQRAGILVALDDRGKEALADDPIVAEAYRRGWMVWGIDPRGIGELETPKSGWAFAVSLLLGENFVWRQGWDINRVLEQALLSAPHERALYARGPNATLAATYALATLAEPPAWTVLREGFSSYRDFIDRPRSLEASYRLVGDDVREQRKTAYDREIPHEFFPFRAFESPDLPQIRAGSGSKIYVIDPINGDWERTAGNSTLDAFVKAKW